MYSQQQALGVIMLDTEFPRPIGDVGHEQSWNIPVRFKRVPSASPDRVIRQDSAGLIDAFINAGNDLIASGCTALITSCGFLARHQRTLSDAFDVPFAASSLVQIPMVKAMLSPSLNAGVITYDANSLTAENFTSSSAGPNTPVIGVPDGGAFRGLIEGGQPYNFKALEDEILTCVRRLLKENPQTGAIVLECTNMPPFAQSITMEIGLPVFDILSVGHWLFQSTQPRNFAQAQQRAI